MELTWELRDYDREFFDKDAERLEQVTEAIKVKCGRNAKSNNQ